MQNITLRMGTWCEVGNFSSQKFRLTSEWIPAGVCILGWNRSRSQYFRFE